MKRLYLIALVLLSMGCGDSIRVVPLSPTAFRLRCNWADQKCEDKAKDMCLIASSSYNYKAYHTDTHHTWIVCK